MHSFNRTGGRDNHVQEMVIDRVLIEGTDWILDFISQMVTRWGLNKGLDLISAKHDILISVLFVYLFIWQLILLQINFIINCRELID